MNFQDLLNSDQPVEFCLKYSHSDGPNIWATSHPKQNRKDAVCFFVENGGYYGYLYEDGRIIDDEEDPFEFVEPRGSELMDRQPTAGTTVPFPAWHDYEIEDAGEFLQDEIPF